MKRLQVVIVPFAEAQIDVAGQYIAQHSVDHADAWLTRVYDAILSLREAHGFAVDEQASAKMCFEVRRYVFERTYLIFYRVDESARIVEVFDFRHGARQP